jgi:hypothetical protein
MAKKSGKRTVSEIMKSEKLEEVEKKSKEITQWIEAILKEELPKSNLRESLLDGVILCKLVNAISPGALKRYHKKPRMLAMKIENIGFFLATCKTRLNLPPALLFQPTDIHDDSNNLASMSKVLNVLSFLKGDGDGGMITGLEDDEDEDEGETPTNKAGDDDPDIEPPDAHTEEPPPQVHTSKPEPTPTVTKAAPPPAASHAELSSADFAEMQTELLKTINDAVNQELSIESKRKLVKILQQQLSSFDEKLINSNDDVLHSILRDVAPDEASKTTSRQTVVEALNIYSRIN